MFFRFLASELEPAKSTSPVRCFPFVNPRQTVLFSLFSNFPNTKHHIRSTEPPISIPDSPRWSQPKVVRYRIVVSAMCVAVLPCVTEEKREHLLLGLEVVEEDVALLGLLTPVLHDNARAVDDLAGVALTVNLACETRKKKVLSATKLPRR